MYSDEEDITPFSMENAEDRAIFMHRDAHFSGNFEEMINYYRKRGKGCVVDFDLQRIEKLYEAEKRVGKNLAPTLLSIDEMQKIGRVKTAYIQLRELYEAPTSKNLHARLIADLIFSEDEDPTAEIAAIVAQKLSIVPSLLDLLRSEDFSDPLFPGYGLAPNLAARCLGAIGDKRAMIALFEAIGESSLFAEEYVLEALKAIGEPAKIFLMKVLQSRPFNRDNEQAAIALLHFTDDPQVPKLALKMLQDKDVFKDLFLATHLIWICEALKEAAERAAFASLAQNPALPRDLKIEVAHVLKAWK